MEDNSKIHAPFSPEQCDRLNAYQQLAQVHPFTCGNNSRHRDLFATPNGWVCWDCDYTQNWAHAHMADAELAKIQSQISAMLSRDPK